MTATTEQLDLASFASKKVTLTFRPDGTADSVTKEGLVQAASPIGLIFKEKGKADVDIVEPDWIDTIEEAAEKPLPITVKKLKPVDKNFRQHLADRHGYLPRDLNDLSEEQGKAIHDGIDHGPLAHKHETPKAQADAAGETDSPIGDFSDIDGAEPEPEDDADIDE